MKKLFGTAIFTLFWLTTVSSASADEMGQAALFIDGEKHQFELNAQQSDWSGSADYASVNITLKAAHETTRSLYPALSVGFEYSGGQVRAIEIRLMKKADSGGILRLYGAPDTGRITLEEGSFAVAGQELSFSGGLETMLGTSENFGRDIDLSNPLKVTGTLTVTLGPV